MLIVGLTGSIGMGKSTVAQMFRDAGVPVHDSDATVHELYSGQAAALIEQEFPGTTADGKVQRDQLAQRVLGDPAALSRLEKIIHPLVAESRTRFLEQHLAAGTGTVVLDIPLLFETSFENQVHAILVVSANQTTQRARVLSRKGMTAERFDQILAKQLPDEEKRKRADFIINTNGTIAETRSQVNIILDNMNKDGYRA